MSNAYQAIDVEWGGSNVSPDFVSKDRELGLFSNPASPTTWLYTSMLLAHEATAVNQPNAAATIYHECIVPAQTLLTKEHVETLKFQRAYAYEFGRQYLRRDLELCRTTTFECWTRRREIEENHCRICYFDLLPGEDLVQAAQLWSCCQEYRGEFQAVP